MHILIEVYGVYMDDISLIRSSQAKYEIHQPYMVFYGTIGEKQHTQHRRRTEFQCANGANGTLTVIQTIPFYFV